VGRALLNLPEVLLLDEPTRSVDLQGRRAFHDLLRELSGARGVAILMATHDLDEAAELGDRVVVLRAGRIRTELRRPRRDEVEAVLSQS
jgi:ABC-type multidrug transport system ATPase subunit